MPLRRRLLWALCLLACMALLLAPALWNGFPLLQYDTGGYLAPWFEHQLAINRGITYGLLLVAGEWPDFWPVLVAQSALTIWVLAITLRAHALGDRPLLLFGIVAALCVLTTLPWLTAILLTDIFAGLGVLALYLLLLRDDALGQGERIGLVLLVAYGAATHSATFAVLLGLTILAAIIWLIDRKRIPFARLRRTIVALALGALIVFAGDFFVGGRLVWTPGGFALSFGRMLQDGIVTKYLDDHCPDASLRLCPYKDQLPRDSDDFFWGGSAFDKLGRFDGLDFGDAPDRAGQPRRLSHFADQIGAHRNRRATAARRYRRRCRQLDLEHLRKHQNACACRGARDEGSAPAARRH